MRKLLVFVLIHQCLARGRESYIKNLSKKQYSVTDPVRFGVNEILKVLLKD